MFTHTSAPSAPALIAPVARFGRHAGAGRPCELTSAQANLPLCSRCATTVVAVWREAGGDGRRGRDAAAGYPSPGGGPSPVPGGGPSVAPGGGPSGVPGGGPSAVPGGGPSAVPGRGPSVVSGGSCFRRLSHRGPEPRPAAVLSGARAGATVSSSSTTS